MCLRKASGIAGMWHSRAARKHLLQIKAPLKCFTKSALSLAIVPRAIQKPAAVENVTKPHPVYVFRPPLGVLGNQN